VPATNFLKNTLRLQGKRAGEFVQKNDRCALHQLPGLFKGKTKEIGNFVGHPLFVKLAAQRV